MKNRYGPQFFRNYINKLDEATGLEDSDSPVAQAVLHRLMRQHPDVIGKHGPDKIMDAVNELADIVGDVEEIGSSDVSIWVNQVLKDLEVSGVQQMAPVKGTVRPAEKVIGIKK